jgi:hypothetical protein
MTVDADALDADTDETTTDEVETSDEGSDVDEGGDSEDTDDADDDAEKPDAETALVVTLGDDEDEEDDSDLPANDDPKAGEAWKKLKAEKKQAERERDELRARVAPAPAAPKIEKPGDRPALKDFDGDENKLADALVKWAKANDAYDAAQSEIKAKSEALAASYRTKIEKLGKSDFKQKQDVVSAAFTHEQQVILLQKTKKTAALVYGLGKDIVKLRRLAAITDPFDFHAALLDEERRTEIIDKRKPPNPPESVVRGNSGGAALKDRTLERLEEQADKTGDRSPVQKYLREKSQKKK